MAASWGKERRSGPKGTYWSLRKGRGKQRVAVSLGYVSESHADAALKRMRSEEAAGRDGRVLALCKRDATVGVRYLVGDPGVAEAFGEPTPLYASWSLRRYVEEVYAPWREEAKPRTWRTEKSHWPRIHEVIGHLRMRDIDEFVVADYLDGLVNRRGKRTGEAASGNTKRLHRGAVQACLKYAYRQRHVPELPDLARFRIGGSTKTVFEKPDSLTLEELMRMMDVSRAVHRCLWAVGAGEGLRPGELVGLDWERRLLTVRGSKTEASHARIPLTPLAFRELRRWEVACGKRAGPIFVVGGKRIREFKTAIRSAAVSAAIGRRVYPYLLRDSFASIAWSLGIEMDAARRVMRHVDERMLLQVYCRPRPEELDRRTRRVMIHDRRSAGG